MQGTKFISVFSGKGGVGKSMLTCLLADYISSSKYKSRNFKVLILDFDDQCSSSRDMLGEEKVISTGEKKQSLPDVIGKLDNYGEFKKLIPPLIHKRTIESSKSSKIKLGEVDVIHSINDSEISNYLVNSTPTISKNLARNLKKYFTDLYDFVLIDLPGSNIPNDYSLIGLLLAENFVLPTTCSAMEIFSFPKTFELLEKIKKKKGNDFEHILHGIVLNMVDRGSKTWNARKEEVHATCQRFGLNKFYETAFNFNASFMNSGLYEGAFLRDRYSTMYVKTRSLSGDILFDLGLRVKEK